MPRIQVHKGHVKKLLILMLVLLCIGGILGGVSLWESHRLQQAMLSQEQIDQPARRRREGWIEKDGQWYVPKSNQETMLIVGVDKTEPLEDSKSYNNDGQADFLLLAIFDTKEEKTTILHLNRDLMTKIPVLGVTGQQAGTITGQLALAHTYGSGLHDSFKNTVKAVSMLLGNINIDHYIGMTMGAVPLLNDMVGGVPVTILDDFTGLDDSLVKGEEITLMGEQALHYIRLRSGLEDSTNLNRMERQQQYLVALGEKVRSLGKDFMPPADQLEKLSAYLLSDCAANVLTDKMKRYVTYPVAELQDIAGEAKKGTEFVEFYPDREALEEQILTLFYNPYQE